jgi:hypothetical protein
VPLAVFDTHAVITPEVQKERDEIYMLAAYAVVYNDWQDGLGGKRGHNIVAVLVDPNHYQGWSESLNACEVDAEDLQSVASVQKFNTRVEKNERDRGVSSSAKLRA